MQGGEEQKKQAVISLIDRQLQKFDEVRELSKKKEEEAKTNEQIFDLPSYAKTESPEIKSTDTQKEKSIKLLQSIRSSFPYDPMNPPETLPINSLMSNPDFSNIVAQQRGMTEKIKPFNPYQPIITDKYDEYLANLRKFSMNINEKDPTSKAKTDLANFLLSVNLYDKPIADPIFSMAMPVLEGKEKINQSLIDISEGKILKGTGRLATGTLQTAFNLIPSVIGLNATLPTFKILGGEAAQLVGSDKETGQKIAEKLAPFVFGKWIGLSSLAAEKVDEEVKDREFFKKLFPDPEDQLIARELLGHVIMLGGILAGHKVDQKYINPTLDKYFPYTRGIKFDPNNKRVKNVMEQFGEEFNYRKRTEGVDKAREWAQQEFQNIIKKVSPEFFNNLKTDIRNIFKEGKNKSRESRASEPTEPISSDSYSDNSFEPTKPAIGSPRLSLPPSDLGKPAPPTIPEPPAPLKPSGQGKGIKMLAPLSPTKYERGNKLESGKEIKLLSQGKEETKTITEEKPTGFAKPEKPEISRTETKPSQHEIEKEKKETQTSSEKVRGKKLLDEIETLKIRLDSFQKANMGLEASNTKKRLEKFQQQYDQLFKPPKDLSDSELEAIANKFKDVPQAQLTTDEKIRKKEITEFIKNNKPELADKIFGEPREKKQIDTAEKKAEKLKQEGKPIEAKGYEKQAERLKKKLDKSEEVTKEEEAVDKSDKGYFGYTPAEIKALKEIANITAPSKYRRWGENGLEKMYGVEVIDRLAKNKLISFQADNNHFNGITIYGKQLLDNISKSQAQEKQTKETQPVKTEAAKKETENLQGSKKQKIYDMPLSEIKLSPKDFQGRELEYSIKSFSDIVGGRIRKALNDDEISLDRAKHIIDEANKYVEKTTGRRLELSLESIPTKEFYWNEFGQIVLWKDKKGNQYVLSGHSRYNSAKFLSQFPEFKEFESVPVVMYSEVEGIDYEKAKELALTSNYMGEKQSLVSNIKYLKNLRDKGLSEEEIKQRAKEFFNKLGSRYYAYSMLSTDGKTMQMLSTMETDNDALESAYWIARARMLFPELNDSHENEMYDFLIEENRYKSSSIPKLTAWQDFISKRVNSAGWSYDKPLNLKGVHKIGYNEMKFEEALREIDDKIKEVEDQIKKKITELQSQNLPQDKIAEAIKSLNDYRARLITERIALANKRQQAIEEDLKQISLFEPHAKIKTMINDEEFKLNPGLREKQIDFVANSKIKDAEGNPLPVFIATKLGVVEYDPEKYDLENAFGKAIYGTTQLRDTENYLNNAQEKLNKINNDTERAEQRLIDFLEDDDPDNFLATLQQYTDLPISKTLIDFAYNYKKKRTEEEEKQIKKELNEIIFSYFSDRYVNSTVNVTYFNIENPFILFPKDSRPRIEALIQLSGDLTKETYVNYSDLEDALRQVNLSMYNISAGYEIISAIENKFRYYLVNKGEYSFDEETEEEDFGEVKASELIQILTDFFYEDVDSYYDADTGKVVSGDIIRQIIEALGYDGVVMVDANAHFNAYRDVVTNHIIAFRTNQVHVDKYNYFEDSDIQIKDKQAIKENNTVFNNIIEQQRLNKVPDELVGKMIFVNPDYEQNIIEGSLESGSMDDIPVYINDEGVFNVIALKKDINESLDNKSLKEISESLTIYFPIDIIKELLDAYGLTEIPQTKFKSLLPADLSTREFKINMLEEAIEKAKFNFYSNFVSRKPYESIIDFNKRAQKEKPELTKYGEYLSSAIEKAFENQAKAKNYDELPPMNFRIRDLIKDLISHLISHRPGSDKIYIQVSYGKTKKIFFPKTTSTIIGSDLTELREKQVFYEAEESEEDVILTHYLSPENLIKAVKFKGNLIIPSLALHRRSFEFFDDLQPTDSDSPCVLIGAKDILFKENVKIYGRDAWTMSVPRTLSILIDKKTMQTVIEKFAKDLLKEADNNKLDVYITIQNEQTNENKNIRIRTPKDLTDYYIKHVIKTSHHIRKEDNIINNFGEKVEGNYFEFNHLYLGYIKTNIRYARKDNPKDGFIEFNSRYNGNHNLISFVNNLFIENNLPYVQTFFLKEIIENVAGEEKPGWKEQQPLSESFINEFVEFARIFGDPRAQTIGKIAGWNIGREIKNFDELREQKDRLLFYLEGNNKANELIKDFADKHKLTYDKFYRILNEYAVINGRLQPQKIIEGIKNEEAWKEIIPNPKEFVDDLNKLIDDVNKASVGYFEAKAYGLFNLSNFSKAIIPNTYAGQLQKALEQHGLEVIVYHDAEDFEENRLTIFDKVYEEGIKVAEADIFDDYSGTGLFGNDEKAPPKSKNSQKLAELKARKTHLELIIEKAKERGLYNPQFEGSTKLNSDVVMEATEELNSIKKQIAALEKKFKESAPKNQIDIFGGIYDEDVNGIVEPQKPPKKAIDDQIELFQKEIRIKQGQLESARNQLDLFNELQEEIKDLNKAIDTLEYAKQKFQDIDEEELKRRGEEGQKIRKEVSKIVQEFIDTTKNRELNKLNTFAVDYENAKKKLIDYLESVKGNDYWKTNEDSYSIFKEQVTRGFERLSKLIHLGIETPSDVIKIGNYIVDSWSGKKLFNKKFLENINIEINQRLRLKSQNMFGIKAPVGNDVKSYADYFKTIAETFDYLNDEKVEHAYFYVEVKDSKEPIILFSGVGDDASVSINSELLQLLFSKLKDSNKTVKRITMIHNHPSGALTPSDKDIRARNSLRKIVNNYFPEAEYSDVIIDARRGFFSVYSQYKTEYFKYDPEEFKHFPKKLLNKVYRISRDVFLEKDLPNFVSQEFQINTKTIVSKLLFSRYNIYGKTFGFLLNHGITKAVFPINVRQYISVKEDFIKELKLLTGTDKLLLVSFQTAADDNFKRILELAAVKSNAADWTIILPVPSEPDNAKIIKQNANTFLSVLEKISNPEYYTELFKDINGDNFDINLLLREPEPDFNKFEKKMREFEKQMPAKLSEEEERRLKELNSLYELTKDEREELERLRKKKQDLLKSDPFVRKRLSTFIKDKIKYYKQGYREGQIDLARALRKIETDILDYARATLPKYYFKRSEVTQIMVKLRNARDIDSMEAAFLKIDEIANKVYKRYVFEKLNRMLRGINKDSRDKGIPNSIINLAKAKRNIEKLEQNIQRLNAINQQRELSDDEEAELYFSTKMMNLSMMTTEQIDEFAEELKSFINGRKTRFQMWQEKEKERIGKLRAEAIAVITGSKGIMPEDTFRKVKLSQKKRSEIAHRILQYDNMMHSFEWFMDALSKYDKSSETLNSFLNRYFATKVAQATIEKNEAVKNYKKIIKHGLEESFNLKGNKLYKLLDELSEVMPTGVFKKVPKLNSQGQTEFTEVELVMSQNEIAKLLLEWEDKTLQKTFEKMNIDPDVIFNLRRILHPGLKNWIRWNRNFYNQYYHTVNDVYKKVKGYDLPYNPYYSPIARDINITQMDSEFLGDTYEFTSIYNGHLQPRTSNSLPLKRQDINLVLMEHILEMEHFKHYAPIMKDLRGVFNSKEVRTAIIQYHDAFMLKILNKFINDFARGGVESKLVVGYLDKLRSNFAKAKIGLNPTVFVKQLTSFPAYMMEIPSKDFFAGVLDFWLNPIGRAKFLMRNSKYMQSRYEKGWERDIILALSQAKKTFKKQISGRLTFTQFSMMLAQIGDGAAIMLGGWSVYKYHYNKYLKQGLSSSEAQKLAIFKFEEATKRSQQSGEIEDLGDMQRGGSWAKLWTLFMTAPKSYYSSVSGAVRNLYFGRGSKIKNLKRLFVAHVLLPTLFQYAADGFYFNYKHLLRAAILGSLNGIFIFGNLLEILVKELFGEKTWDFEGNPIESIGKESIEAAQSIRKLIDREEITAEDVFETVDDLATAVSSYIGIPYQPISRIQKGVDRYFKGKTLSPMEMLGFNRKLFEPEPEPEPKEIKLIKEKESRLNKLRKEARETLDKDTIEKVKALKREIEEMKKSKVWKEYLNKQKEEKKKDIFYERPKVKDNMMQDFQLNNFGF